MAQNHLKLGSYTAPEVDEDGYQISMATTSTENSGRTMRGNMKNSPLFTVEAYELKWTDLPAKTGGEILKQYLAKRSLISSIITFTRECGKHHRSMLQISTHLVSV